MAGFDLLAQRRLLLSQLFQRPAENAAKPGVNIAEGGLACLHADKVWNHAAVDLAADAFDRALADALFIGDQNVAGGGADDFHQRVRLRAGANGAHVAVKGAAGDGHTLRQTQALGPLCAQRADRHIGRPGIGEQRPGQMLVDDGIKLIEEAGRRQTAPALMPQRFMSGAAAAAAQILRTRSTGEQGGHPVAKLYPRGGCLGDGAIFAGDVKDFGPEPFAGVDTADIARVILFARLVTQAGDRLGFLDRGVILPQDKHGVRVVSEFFAQRQHVALGINGSRG